MEEERKSRLAKMLRELRGDRTQAEVAKGINVSFVAIYRYEAGERLPSVDMLVRLAEYYHVSADTLLGLSIDDTGRKMFFCDYCEPDADWMSADGAYWTEWMSDTDINTGFLRCSLDHNIGLNRTSEGIYEIRSEIGSGDSYRTLRIPVNYCPVCGRRLL